ncbi:MAG: DUF47 family protein [Polyangiales bacterium]
MAFQGVIRWILPRDDQFFTHLEALGTYARQSAEAFASFRDGKTADEVREAVQIIEHQADGIVRELEDALARTFVTPIDREDIHRLSNELDDIIDLTNLAARTCGLYGIKSPSRAMTELMDTLVEDA